MRLCPRDEVVVERLQLWLEQTFGWPIAHFWSKVPSGWRWADFTAQGGARNDLYSQTSPKSRRLKPSNQQKCRIWDAMIGLSELLEWEIHAIRSLATSNTPKISHPRVCQQRKNRSVKFRTCEILRSKNKHSEGLSGLWNGLIGTFLSILLKIPPQFWNFGEPDNVKFSLCQNLTE